MKRLTNLLIPLIFLTGLSFAPNKSKAQDFESFYTKGGYSSLTFIDSDLRDIFGNIPGGKIAGGTNLSNDLRGEISLQYNSKKLEDGGKLSITEMGGYIDYMLGIFYGGVGLKANSIKDEIDTYPSKGYAFRIGAEVEIPIKDKQSTIYGEVENTYMNNNGDLKDVNLNTTQISIGLKF